jgi:sarcosine oxidase
VTQSAEIIVVGLGAMGSAVLCQLARRGVAAIGIDRFDPPPAFGSSHGESRITRVSISEGARYIRLSAGRTSCGASSKR